MLRRLLPLAVGAALAACQQDVGVRAVEPEIRPAPTLEAEVQEPEVVAPRVIEPDRRVDLFQQVEARADILWVVDSSASMAEEQEKLAQEFTGFIEFLAASEVDYHVATTAMDLSQTGFGGRIHGPEPVITTETLDPVAAFAGQVAFPATLAAEQGLEAARRALSEPNLSGANRGFLRPDAALSVIFVSDDEDQSPGSAGFYRRFFLGAKGAGNRALVKVSAIVGPSPDGCLVPGDEDLLGGRARAGERYRDVVEATGGTLGSICDEDFGPAVEALGLGASGLKRIFPLSREPRPETLAVRVDDLEVPQDAAAGWTWQPETRSISFAGSYLPPAGSRIEVAYRVVPGGA